MTRSLLGNADYLNAARQAIPTGYAVAGETVHPNFLTADFALVRTEAGELAPRLVEIQAFPSVYGDVYKRQFWYITQSPLGPSMRCQASCGVAFRPSFQRN